jgi:hypothetical protein
MTVLARSEMNLERRWTLHPPGRRHELQPRRLVLFEVDQKFGQPLGISAERRTADQRGSVSLRAREDVEQLAGAGFANGGKDAADDVIVVHGFLGPV